ncbi:hypothetical protein IF1G_03029 [Cordyceps javanica]|uniref:Uncharacterized protein n=1 Tax=Cordyceps javanica TaxID=43265 RepID=A0A545VBG3_9HYPO|nr:hypothetical protein IF1G_03029 [Cordyceps javanica]
MSSRWATVIDIRYQPRRHFLYATAEYNLRASSCNTKFGPDGQNSSFRPPSPCMLPRLHGQGSKIYIPHPASYPRGAEGGIMTLDLGRTRWTPTNNSHLWPLGGHTTGTP